MRNLKRLKLKGRGLDTVQISFFGFRISGRAGFSYVEIMIVMVLVVLASLDGTISIIKFYRTQQPVQAIRSIGAVLRDAEQRAIAQEGGRFWGVRIENLAGRDRYVLFSASDTSLAGFTTSSTTYLPASLSFSEPASSSTILFSKMTGGWANASCPSGVASSTVTIGGNSVRVYCNGKIE